MYCKFIFSYIAIIALLSGCSGGGSSGSSDTDSSSSINNSTVSASTSAEVPVRQAANVVLSWPIPAKREDGSALPLASISGYEITYQGSVTQLHIINIQDPQTTLFQLSALAPDHYEFVIFAYDTNNAVSQPSPTVTLKPEDFPML